VRYGVYPLNTFIAMTWEVLTPIEPAGRTADDVVKEAEVAIRKNLGQAPLPPEGGIKHNFGYPDNKKTPL